MKKSILNLKGSKMLSANEKKSINGGAVPFCQRHENCAVAACMKYWTVESCFGQPHE